MASNNVSAITLRQINVASVFFPLTTSLIQAVLL